MDELLFQSACLDFGAINFSTCNAVFVANVNLPVRFYVEDLQVVRKLFVNVKNDPTFFLFLIKKQVPQFRDVCIENTGRNNIAICYIVPDMYIFDAFAFEYRL